MATKESLMARTVRVGDCLEWQGHINRSGYGSVWHAGKNRDVHRVSFELHKGEIPDGMHIMHSCDNRPCINPDHLNAGTRHQNMVDMFLKDRHRVRSGIKHHNSKLSPEDATAIRARFVPYDRKNGSSALAREFGVRQSTIHALLRGVTWQK